MGQKKEHSNNMNYIWKVAILQFYSVTQCLYKSF